VSRPDALRDPFLWAGGALYAAAIAALDAQRYAVHRNFVDFGIFAQTAASAFSCFCNTVEGSHWAFHFSPILSVPGLLLLVRHSPYVFFTLQGIACAAVAPPIAAMVAARTDLRTGRLAALCVWLYPPLAGLGFDDFHENLFAPAAVAWMLWAFERRRFGAAAISAALVLAVKEDQALFLAWAGAWAAWSLRREDPARARFAAVCVVAALLIAAVFFLWIQPHANVNPHWQPERFYAWTAADLRALPLGIVERLGFLLLISAPLAFLPWRSPMIVAAFPPLAEVLLSRMSTTFTLGTHYAGAWLGWWFGAFADAVRTRKALAWALAFAAIEFLVADPLHPGLNLRPVQARDRALDAFLASLPHDLPVATQEEAYTHLALRDPHATVLPDDPRVPLPARYVLVDEAYPDSPRLQEYGPALHRLERAGILRTIRRDGAITLYAVRSVSPERAGVQRERHHPANGPAVPPR
jgi:uncharacterized membrane protein